MGFSAGPDGFQTSHWREGRRIHDGVSCTQILEPQVGIKAGLVFGFKKTRYKGEDYGTVVMTTYTAQA